jgi:hypothetical protein
MSSFLRDLPAWQSGKRLSIHGLFLFYDPETDQEYKVTPDQLIPGSSAPVEPGSASDFVPIAATTSHPAFDKNQNEVNLWVLARNPTVIQEVQAPKAPAAPTNGRVDDTGDTFAGNINPLFTGLGDYEIYYPGSNGNQPATNGRADLVAGVLTIRGLTGSIGPNDVGMRVAANGNRPESPWLTNKVGFTGPAVPPTTTTPDAPFPSFDATTRTLTYQHALGTSELEINHLGGSYQPYAAVSVDDSSHGAGEWKARVKAYIAGNRTASGSADSPAIAAKVATTAPNQKPTVSFSPSTNTAPMAGVQKDYLALATDPAGLVQLTQLVQVTSSTDLTVLAVLASDVTSPYALSWTPQTSGTVYLAARAVDDKGAEAFSSVVAVTVLAATTTPPASEPFWGLMFESNGTPHLLTGPTRTNLTTERTFIYQPPAGTNVRDATIWQQNGQGGFAHSGYYESPYIGTSLVVGKFSTLASTGPVYGSVVHQINMLVPGRIPAVPGYATVGNNAIFSSPSYVPRPNGKVGLFFMFQPDGLPSTSYIMYIESLDATLTKWSNVVLVTGAMMPYNNGGGRQSGSYIDPFYFYHNGEHYLYLRCFTTGNGPDTCLGLRIFKSSNLLNGYDTLVLDLYTQAAGGTNPYVTARQEGQQAYFYPDGSFMNIVDAYDQGGYLYTSAADGLTNSASYGPLTKVGQPAGTNYTLRHGDIRDLTLTLPAVPDDASTGQITYPTASTAPKPVVGITITKTADDDGSGYAKFTGSLNLSVGSPTAFRVNVQVTNGTGSKIIPVDVAAYQTTVPFSGSSLRMATSYTNIQTVVEGDGYTPAASPNNQATFNVTGTGAAATGLPVITFQTEKTSEDEDAHFTGRFSADRILTSPLDVVVLVTNDLGTFEVIRTIEAGRSQKDFYGISGRLAESYNNVQVLQERATYIRGAQYQSTFVVNGTSTATPPTGTYQRIEDNDPRLSFVGNWKPDNNQVESGGTLKYLQSDGYVEFLNFPGGTFRLFNPGFGTPNVGVKVTGIVKVNEVTQSPQVNYTGYEGEASQLRLQLNNLPAGTLRLYFNGGDLHFDCCEIDV